MRYNHFSMLPERAFCPVGGRMTLEGGGSSSSSSNSQETTNVDRRQVVGEGSVGVSSDSSTVNVSVLDSGAIDKAGAIASQAIAAVSAGTVTQQQGFALLLDATSKAIGEVFKVIDKNTALVGQVTGGVADAYEVAQSSASGARDLQKLVLVAGGIIAVIALINRKKG